MKEEKTLSVVIPAYNEEEMVRKAYTTIEAILSEAGIPHAFVFVDDGSKDKTWEIIESLASENDNVTGVRFSRNFGKESAINAGLSCVGEKLTGGCCAVIDCDLQHPAETLVEMYRLWLDGYEVIEGVKHDRGRENLLHKFSAVTFYAAMNQITGFDFKRASDFKLLDEKAVRAILSMREKHAFFRALSSWVGFKTTQIEFDVREREAGESKWSIRSLIRYAIRNLTSFTTAPMQIVTVLGGITSVGAVVFGIVALVRRIMGAAFDGWALLLFFQLLTSGILMIALGLIGLYIAKIYEEVRDRPKYIIADTCGKTDQTTER